MDQRRQKVWVGACAGARIYRTGTKYMRIIYPQVYNWNMVLLRTTDICLNIWKGADVIGFTGEIFFAKPADIFA